jgi:ribosome maturation protein SDO1
MFTPINQKRLTNVAVVRLKHDGKRFEIACYQNKVLDWRNGIETDLHEVLQSTTVFTNVSKGLVASQADIDSFNVGGHSEEVCRLILKRGDLQVSDKERKAQQDQLLKEVATVIANKCINIDTNRPFPISLVEHSLRQVHFSLSLSRSAKQQALEAIKLLKDQGVLNLARAQMRILITFPAKTAKKTKTVIAALVEKVEDEKWLAQDMQLTVLVDPGNFRKLEEALGAECKGQGRVEILEMSEANTAEAEIEALETKTVNSHAHILSSVLLTTSGQLITQESVLATSASAAETKSASTLFDPSMLEETEEEKIVKKAQKAAKKVRKKEKKMMKKRKRKVTKAAEAGMLVINPDSLNKFTVSFAPSGWRCGKWGRFESPE